jgi:phosphoglycerol geranylgeranyltransferase
VQHRQSIILERIKSIRQGIAILVDPDKTNDPTQLTELIERVNFSGADFFFVGGSTVSQRIFESTVAFIKEKSKVPVVLFPGSHDQISAHADALLYLSLLSGRNPDYLIGHHVQSSLELYQMSIEIIPTSYLLIDGGTSSSVAYVSQTTPIPRDHHSIIRRTVLAGIFQGKKLTYLDAGSGAQRPVSSDTVKSLTEYKHPIIVGGGIQTIEEVEQLHKAGANVVVIGNKIERDTDFLLDIQNYKRRTNKSVGKINFKN